MSFKQPDAPYALLLLPPVPQPPTYLAIKAAFHSSLLLSIRHLLDNSKGGSPPSRVTIDVAVSCPHLYNTTACRASLYTTTQSIVANIYKLICVNAARQGIEVADVDGEGVVDARVILLAYPRDGSSQQQDSGVHDGADGWFGPVIGLRTLAESQRRWQTVLSVETDQGERLFSSFKTLSGSAANDIQYVKVKGGVVQVDGTTEASDAKVQHMCKSVAVGGTLDHLHIGHKLLLTMVAFALDAPVFTETAAQDDSEKVITIGMTAADLLAKKKYAEMLQSWRTRTDRTHFFMQGIMCFGTDSRFSERVEEVHNPGPNGHAVLIHLASPRGKIVLRYTEIWDPFGPTITDPDIDTLIVSGETRSGGKMVNDKRLEMKMNALQVLEVDVLDTSEEQGTEGDNAESKAMDSEFQAKLSSTEIRRVQAERLKRRSRV